MIDRLHHRGWHYALLIVLSAFLFFLNLGGAALWDIDEGCYASCSLEMMEADNWIVPTFNGQLYVHKPALLYWLQILSYRGFGVNEFAARFPSALAALGTVLLAYELARSMFSRTTGLIAGVIVVSTPMMCGAARFANQDSLLNFFTVLTLTVFWMGLAERRWWWFLLLGVASGLAVLAKGPVGLVLPGAVTLLFFYWQRQLHFLWDPRLLLAMGAFVITAVPWFILVSIETHGKFLPAFLWTHNINRGLHAMEGHDGFPGYYLVVLVVGTAPWSIFLMLGCWFGFWSAIRCPWLCCQSWWARTSEAGAHETENSPTDKPAAYRLLACWILVFLLAFSVAATKLPNYILPVVVPSALLIARFLQRWRTGSVQIPNGLVHLGVVVLALIGVFVFVLVTIVGGTGELSILRDRDFRGLDNWGFLGAVPIAAAGACWWFARVRKYDRFIVTLAICAVLLLGPIAAFASSLFNGCKAPQTLVEETYTLRPDEDIRIGCWELAHLPSLNFYLKRDVQHIQDKNELANFLKSHLPVYVFIPRAAWTGMEGTLGASTRVIGQKYDMYHHTDVIVVTNRR
jgi:4-amino-4-deoxy-L-arabinose transferase-like glycosyltransferase